MIKVVRKQKKQKCNKCGAVLKFEAEDIQVVKDSNGRVRDSYLECPICKYKIWFA